MVETKEAGMDQCPDPVAVGEGVVGEPMLVKSSNGWHVLGEDGQRFNLVAQEDPVAVVEGGGRRIGASASPQTKTMDEVWLPIAGYEGLYEVSDQGSVRRVRQLNARYGSNRKLIGDVDHKGYPRVLLSKDLIKRRFFVHRLVCAAFHGAPPPGTEVGHRNGIRSDARAENLRWITRSENNKDTIAHGHWNSPTKGRARKDHPMAKYSDEMISQIIADMHAGLGSRRISKKYGISQTYAGHIKRVHVRGADDE